MQIATDSTAGERERGSLEPLLVNPAPRGAIAPGKWLAATFASMLSVLLTTALCWRCCGSSRCRTWAFASASARRRCWACWRRRCRCACWRGLQTYLATFARSFKEAQSYMGILIMVPMLPGMLGTLYPIASQPWMYPSVLGQHVLPDVLGGKADDPLWAFLVAAVVCVLAAAALLRATVALLNDERIVFGR